MIKLIAKSILNYRLRLFIDSYNRHTPANHWRSRSSSWTSPSVTIDIPAPLNLNHKALEKITTVSPKPALKKLLSILLSYSPLRSVAYKQQVVDDFIYSMT